MRDLVYNVLAVLFLVYTLTRDSAVGETVDVIVNKLNELEKQQKEQQEEVIGELKEQNQLLQRLLALQLDSSAAANRGNFSSEPEPPQTATTAKPDRWCSHPDDPTCFPTDCSEVFIENKEEPSGVYRIFINEKRTPINVFCHFSDVKKGAGWLVFQRRYNGQQSFNQGWKAYEDGFGSPPGEYWLGLKTLHQITSKKNYELRIDMRYDLAHGYAMYGNFSIDGAAHKYKLHLGDFVEGTAGDSLKRHNRAPFSTKDNDNDKSRLSCARMYRGGWWFHSCMDSNLNGLYTSRTTNSIIWTSFEKYRSLKKVQMMIRPVTHGDGKE